MTLSKPSQSLDSITLVNYYFSAHWSTSIWLFQAYTFAIIRKSVQANHLPRPLYDMTHQDRQPSFVLRQNSLPWAGNTQILSPQVNPKSREETLRILGVPSLSTFKSWFQDCDYHFLKDCPSHTTFCRLCLIMTSQINVRRSLYLSWKIEETNAIYQNSIRQTLFFGEDFSYS